jgi:hypothetical protein
MGAPDRLKIGMPFRRIVKISKEPFGPNGGHLLVLHLACGHVMKHMNTSGWTKATRTRCEDCR